MLKRKRPRSKARLLLREECGWQTASRSCAWGRERGRGCRQSSRPGCSQSSSDLVVPPLAGPGLESATEPGVAKAQAGLPSCASFKPTLQSLHHTAPATERKGSSSLHSQ